MKYLKERIGRKKLSFATWWLDPTQQNLSFGSKVHPLIRINSFLVHKGNIRNFIVLYNTLGIYTLNQFEGPYFVLIFKLFNYWIYIFEFQLSSYSFLHSIGLKTKDYTIW
jgi:hypothetical protein